MIRKLLTKDELLVLGTSVTEGKVYVTQQEREGHMWVMGTSGEGKSRLLRYLTQQDIDRLMKDFVNGLSPKTGRSCSLCFIDATPNGANAYQILNYCAKIGYPKVYFIDPKVAYRSERLAVINPINYNHIHIKDSVDSLLDVFKILFAVEEASITTFVNNYLRAVLTVLHYGDFTLHDLIYFTLPPDKDNDTAQDYEDHRKIILSKVKAIFKKIPLMHQEGVIKHIADIEMAFKNFRAFKEEFATTSRRINQYVNDPFLLHTFNHRKGIKFDKLVSEGGVLLVNASPGDFGELSSRFLVTVIINEIIQATRRIWGDAPADKKKPYYIYLDEAQTFGNEKLYKSLNELRNDQVRFILANHFPSQFRGDVLNSVRGNTHIKVAFWESSPHDRAEILSEFYGSEATEAVEKQLEQQQKRVAVFKAGKKKPVIAKIPLVPELPRNEEAIKALFESSNYTSIADVVEDFNARFYTQGDDSKRPGKGGQSNRRTNSTANRPKTGHDTKDAQKNASRRDTRSTEAHRTMGEILLEIDRERGDQQADGTGSESGE